MVQKDPFGAQKPVGKSIPGGWNGCGDRNLSRSYQRHQPVKGLAQRETRLKSAKTSFEQER